MTCRPDIGEDVHHLFMQLTGLGRAEKLNKLLQSPFTLQPGLLARIHEEAERARAGHEAWIRAKMNALSDSEVIHALYEASRAGVKIDLVVRSICCLLPGVEGVSENIHVRSVVGRFLEHTRVFAFCNGGEPLVYLASADWMQRNLYRRVETCFPIEDPALARRVIEEGLDIYLADTADAWVLGPDASYSQVLPDESTPPLRAQHALRTMTREN